MANWRGERGETGGRGKHGCHAYKRVLATSIFSPYFHFFCLSCSACVTMCAVGKRLATLLWLFTIYTLAGVRVGLALGWGGAG